MNTPRNRRVTALAVATLAGLAACQDAPAPVAPSPDETVLTEAPLEMAGQAADVNQDDHFGQAERARDRDRDRYRDQDGLRLDRVALVVAFGATSVELATTILEREGADDRQAALLQEAVRLQQAAEEALQQGDPGAATRLSRQACWTALKAWVLPGGVTREEAEKVQTLAHDLVVDAVAAVGDDDGIRGLILSWSVAFYQAGAQALEEGHLRGVAALWKAAVLASFLLA